MCLVLGMTRHTYILAYARVIKCVQLNLYMQNIIVIGPNIYVHKYLIKNVFSFSLALLYFVRLENVWKFFSKASGSCKTLVF